MDPDLRAFLQQRLIARLTTIDSDGYPHTVPIWYMVDGEDIVVATGPTSRKIKHIRANPHGSLVIGGDPTSDQYLAYQTCYLLQGDFSIEGEPGFDLIRVIARRYRTDDQIERDIADWGLHQTIRFTIKKVSRVMP